jgi:hypothetical protein
LAGGRKSDGKHVCCVKLRLKSGGDSAPFLIVAVYILHDVVPPICAPVRQPTAGPGPGNPSGSRPTRSRLLAFKQLEPPLQTEPPCLGLVRVHLPTCAQTALRKAYSPVEVVLIPEGYGVPFLGKCLGLGRSTPADLHPLPWCKCSSNEQDRECCCQHVGNRSGLAGSRRRFTRRSHRPR